MNKHIARTSIVIVLFGAGGLRALCPPGVGSQYIPPGINVIGVIPYGFGDLLQAAYNGANNLNSGCWQGPGNGPRPTPTLAVGITGDWTVSVSIVDGHAPTATGGSYPMATTRNGEVIIYKQWGPVDNVQPTGWNVFERLQWMVTHELGHVLRVSDDDCFGDVMNGDSDPYSAQVTSDDCYVADIAYETYDEIYSCWPHDNCYYCPILISLSGNGYHLLEAANGVTFDIAADRIPDRIAWTLRGSDDAFLWLDRNGDGAVNDGGELFGNATRLLSGTRAINGFEALKEFDTNGDGVIDNRDPIWRRLKLWVDSNHDGVSSRDELLAIDQTDIVAIRLDYRLARRVDRFGNRFQWTSRILRRMPGGGVREEQIFDVIFAH